MNSRKRTIPEMFTSISPEIGPAKPPPKITVSTLKGFQLLESSSDDISSSDEEDDESWEHRPTANSSRLHLSNDATIPCPALDQMCEEYFENEKDNSAAKRYNEVQNSAEKHIEGAPRPSHLYFYSTDVRIRNLVRGRLPNFSPLDDSTDGVLTPPGAESIDYMRQFGKAEGSSAMSQATIGEGRGKAPMDGKKKNRTATTGTSGRRVRKAEGKRPEKSTRFSSGIPFMEERSTADPISWLTPKSETKPKNAGKRRVHAGRSSGFWYTAEGGRKVYVTKTGEELSGTCAYRSYKKENRQKKVGVKQKKK